MNQGMLYVHIPFCVQKCRYCDFLSFSASDEERQLYVDALCKEIDAWEKKETDPISSVFIGGGTPSLLLPKQLGQIMRALHNSFRIESSAEQTIEVNPGTVTKETAQCWKQEGINRVSMGVQALDDQLLKRLGRVHDRKQVFDSWSVLKAAGFDNVSFDLMMGLPSQSLTQWESTLKEALKLEPRHLSCYSLIIEEGTAFYEQQSTLDLPNEDMEREMYYSTYQILEASGLYQYEISNFARPNYESKHNIGYWRRKPYIGLGLGAASLLKQQIRYHNTHDMKKYLQNSADPAAIREEEARLEVNEQMEEFMFLGLRCTQGVQKSEFNRCFGKSIDNVYKSALKKHYESGLLECEGDWIRLSRRGMDVANLVLSDFLLDQ